MFPNSSGARAGGPAHASVTQTPAFCKESGALPRPHPRSKSSEGEPHHGPEAGSYPGMGFDAWRTKLANDHSDFCPYPEPQEK